MFSTAQFSCLQKGGGIPLVRGQAFVHIKWPVLFGLSESDWHCQWRPISLYYTCQTRYTCNCIL